MAATAEDRLYLARRKAISDIQCETTKCDGPRDRDVHRIHLVRGSQHLGPDRRRLHIPQRAARQALRHCRHGGKCNRSKASETRRKEAKRRNISTRLAAGSQSWRAAHTSECADGHLESDANVTRQTRPLGAAFNTTTGQPSRRSFRRCQPKITSSRH
jgi:hypothetical protein